MKRLIASAIPLLFIMSCGGSGGGDVQQPQNQFSLSVTKSGTGSGTIASSPAGINCGGTCHATFNSGTTVILTATPDANSTFAGWSGDPDCSDGQVTMDANKTCTAIFTSSVSTTENSPFGIFGPYVSLTAENPLTSVSKSDVNSILKDIGAKWVEEMPVEDSIDKLSLETAVNIYSRVGCMGKTPPYTSDQKCKDSIRSTIKQYKDKIKHWEFGTEPNGFPPPMGWKGYGKEYAQDIKEAYTIIKQECPDCYVVFGGLTGQGVGTAEIHGGPADFLKDALGGGAGDYFDVFEFKQHGANADDYKEIGNRLTIYSKIFSDNGLDLKKQKLIFLETATHDGCPTSNPEQKCQTQAQQAAGLLKYYVYSMGQGVDKIFWNLIYERHNFGVPPAPPGSSPFDYYGLVNNPDNDGDSSKKLDYYTYKKMVEILEGSDWNNIQTIQESGDVYIYKFTKNNKPIYVAWWDYFNDSTYTQGNTKQVTITGLQGSTMLVTEAVPKFSSGKDVTDYNIAFKTETKSVVNGQVTISLGDSPVFVEVLR